MKSHAAEDGEKKINKLHVRNMYKPLGYGSLHQLILEYCSVESYLRCIQIQTRSVIVSNDSLF